MARERVYILYKWFVSACLLVWTLPTNSESLIWFLSHFQVKEIEQNHICKCHGCLGNIYFKRKDQNSSGKTPYHSIQCWDVVLLFWIRELRKSYSYYLCIAEYSTISWKKLIFFILDFKTAPSASPPPNISSHTSGNYIPMWSLHLVQ